MTPKKIKISLRFTGVITVLYGLLLCYIIAILVAWGFFLERQNRDLTRAQVIILGLRTDAARQPEAYRAGMDSILRQERLHTWQYLGEGGTFLLIILIGAGYVYGAVRRQIRLSGQQLNFMMAITHELKSPIAVIQLNMETLARHNLDEDKRRALMENTIHETHRLNHLCNNMLLASQLESRQYRVVPEPLDLGELLEQCVRENQLRWRTRAIRTDFHARIGLEGDRLMLHLAFNNLLENALKYSPVDSPVTVSLRSESGHALVRVTDLGAGIPESEKSKIFNRFYRIGNENTRSTKGTGLGLYLSRTIIRQHGGRIRVMDNAPKGSIFEIDLPGSPAGGNIINTVS